MTSAAKKDLEGKEAVAWENPLIPNKKLRALYVTMVELRLLGEYLASPKRRPRAGAASEVQRGHEGCIVSTTLDLKRGDLTSDATVRSTTAFLRGEKLAEAIASASGKSTGTQGQLPAIANSVDRLHLAMGMALSLKTARRKELLIAYVRSDELDVADWRPILGFAAQQILPVVFVVLPRDTKSTKQDGRLSLAASKCGVPGIPVDAADPVALFRVAQESMLRARAGGGPVLMECISFHLPGRKVEDVDPIATMREFLLHRTIVDDAWLHSVETSFAERLKATNRQG